MKERRYDLDWLRVLAILSAAFFHCSMPFVAEWGWHIKNADTSYAFLEISNYLVRWRMPLLFFISGIGTYFVLEQLSKTAYIWQRIKRLFFPLVFGILVLVPPQIFYERLHQGIPYSSLIQFYPSIWNTGTYPEGNLGWNHLWFIAYLLIYSCLGLPIFMWLRTEAGQAFTDRVAAFTNRTGLYVLAVPVFLATLLYFPFPTETYRLIGDWTNLARYFTYFMLGYFVGNHPGIWSQIMENRRKHLMVAFCTTVFVYYIRWNNLGPAWDLGPVNLSYLFIRVLDPVMWMLAFMGYAKKYLNFSNPFLKYANEGIYPFYLLHQTVIVALAYYVLKTTDTVPEKYLFLAFSSFFVCVGFYEFFIRPFPVIRFLFGMKSRPK